MDHTATPSPPGLTSAEVAVRIAAGQVNRVRRSEAAAYADIVRRNVLTLFNALVVPAAIALFLLEEYRGAVAVSGMAIANTVLGLVQEIRAKRHLDRLAILSETRVRVMRDGGLTEVPSGDVVLGDLLLLAAGEPVVADGRVIEARFLEVDEALLTGESDPVPRRPGDAVLSGSFCVAGEGCYRAERVGAEAFAQRTAKEARAYRYTASPLQETIDRLIRILSATAVFLCVLYFLLYAAGWFPRENPHEARKDLVQMVAATITSMVPQGLVLMTTLAFLLGAVRMAARGAVVQRLSSVESMAAVNVLCMDKTGTLTTNRLRLEKLVPVGSGSAEFARERLRLFVSASLDRGNKSLEALRAALGETPVELIDQLPFKSQNRYSAVRVRSGGEELVLALGAAEALRPFVQGPPDWTPTWQTLMQTGLRLLLFAEAISIRPETFQGALKGFTLRPLALVGLSDELRPEAGAVLEGLAAQGIDFKVLSGDNPETVRATVRPFGERASAPALRALAEGEVVTGTELEKAANPTELIVNRSVFGRVAPAQKVEVVTALREQGRHVAMIGDGVNDVLPIKTADLGIAMGEGSRAARTVAGLVLETNDFGLLPATLEEGRTIVRNLRRAAKLFLLKNVYVLVLIVGALGVFGLPFPFLPQQVTLLNALTIGLPALLFTLSKQRTAAASRPGFLGEVGWFVLPTGFLTGAGGLTLMLFAKRAWGEDEMTQRTLLLSLLIFLGAANLLRVLTDGEMERLPGDRKFRFLAAGVVPVYLVALYWPLSAWYHELTPLTLAQWGGVLGVALPTLGAMLLTDRLRRHRE
jgi:cation-transporting ATPase E